MTGPPVACFREPTTPAGWLVRELQCPSDATVLAVYAVGFAIVVSVAWRLHRRGLSEEAVRGVITNAWGLACCVAPAWVAAYGLGLSGPVAVLTALLGVSAFLATRSVVVTETMEVLDDSLETAE